MSENLQDNPGIKISPHPEIQKKVEEQEALIKEHVPQLDYVTRNRLARHETAKNLKLDKRAKETAKAKELSLIDDLTRLHNKRWFTEQLEIRAAEASRNGTSFKVVYFDLDLFKVINDTYGHPVGDSILKLFKSIGERTDEPICRIGGEEFAAIVNTENQNHIDIMLGRYTNNFNYLSKKVLEDKKTITGANTVNPPREATFSAGIAEYKQGMTSGEITDMADKGLYYAKHILGRNAVAVTTKNDAGNYVFEKLPIK